MSSFSRTLSYVCPHLMVLGQSYVCPILNLLENVVLLPFSSPGIKGYMSLTDVQHFFYFSSSEFVRLFLGLLLPWCSFFKLQANSVVVSLRSDWLIGARPEFTGLDSVVRSPWAWCSDRLSVILILLLLPMLLTFQCVSRPLCLRHLWPKRQHLLSHLY